MLLTATEVVFSHPQPPPPVDFAFCARCHGEIIELPEKNDGKPKFKKICGSCGLPVGMPYQHMTFHKPPPPPVAATMDDFIPKPKPETKLEPKKPEGVVRAKPRLD